MLDPNSFPAARLRPAPAPAGPGPGPARLPGPRVGLGLQQPARPRVRGDEARRVHVLLHRLDVHQVGACNKLNMRLFVEP